MADDIREKLKDKGWGRHSCIVIDESIIGWLTPLVPEGIRELFVLNNLLILSTYDCAIINHCFIQEPWINVLMAQPIPSLKKDYQNGRNERKLHFSVSIDGDKLPFEVNAASIFQFERKHLLKLEKSTNVLIDDNTSFSLKHWLAERFRRDVWPDAFNRTIKKAQNRLKAFYKRRNDFVSGVYLKLDTWDEKEENEKYTISAIIAIEDGKLRSLRKTIKQSEKSLANADNNALDTFLRNELKNALGDTVQWEKDPTLQPLRIALDVKAEEHITLTHQKYFRRLNPYNLSDESDNAPMPAEM